MPIRRFSWVDPRVAATVVATMALAAVVAGPATADSATAGSATAGSATEAPPAPEVKKYENLAYGPARPGNLFDLYVPTGPRQGGRPLIIWHSGSAWLSNAAKDQSGAVAIADEFTARGYAVATISIRSSADARFPAQGQDVRAAIRYLRENSAKYGIDPNRFAFMGDSSGGWATTFAAMTSDTRRIQGERARTSSAVQVAVAFFPPTDFLSMDDFAAANNLPQAPGIYPHDAPTSPESLLVSCPGEGSSQGPPDTALLVSIQECPAETEKVDPSSYIQGQEIPIWLLHGLADPLLPYNQSQLVYKATAAEGNVARLTLVPGAGHSVDDIIDAPAATTTRSAGGREQVTEGSGPSWNDIDRFIRSSFNASRQAQPRP